MIDGFVAGFIESCTSARSWFTAAAVGAYGMLQFGSFTASVASNAWDVLLPAMTDATVLANIALAWWLTWLIPGVVRSAQTARLIRHGSPTIATISHLIRLAGNMLGVLLLCSLVLTAEGLSQGWDITWSDSAKVASTDSVSAFTSAALRHWFLSPVLAAFSSTVYAMIGYLAIAAVVTALACRGLRSTAYTVALGFCTWTLFCSFAPIGVPPAFDSTEALELAWVLNTPYGLYIGLGWWFVLALTAVGVLTARHDAVHVRAWSGRLGSTILLVGILVVNALDASRCAHLQGRDVSECFFAGSAGDIISYTILAAIPLGFATTFLARITSGGGGLHLVQALQSGSFRRWLGRLIARESAWALGLTLCAGFLVIVASFVAGDQPGPLNTWLIFRCCAALFGAIMVHLSLAAALLWLPMDLTVTWLALAGTSLVLGYTLSGPTAWLNVFAPYSVGAGVTPGLALVSTVVIVGVLAVVIFMRATPKHAEQLV